MEFLLVHQKLYSFSIEIEIGNVIVITLAMEIVFSLSLHVAIIKKFVKERALKKIQFFFSDLSLLFFVSAVFKGPESGISRD